ncbi:MAG: hypothetical protein CMF25_03390 [Kangiellaceae bacterium]|jgi:uncharacterized membrane-anchored protein YhcB (DUF1043 family)|nr:hypothetical protein [Kangiellaceae bacterium]|tara:strand:+ start:4462 stop:5052 length:591 start_codon:yes stop_codon:yes gene_type:complete
MITVLLAATIGFIVGVGVGYLMARSSNTSEHQELGERLNKSEEKLEQYQQNVAEHFAETSNLVHKLTENYRDLYAHLRTGANDLVSDDELRKLINDQTPNRALNSEEEAFVTEAGDAPAESENDTTLEPKDADPAVSNSETTAEPVSDASKTTETSEPKPEISGESEDQAQPEDPHLKEGFEDEVDADSEAKKATA